MDFQDCNKDVVATTVLLDNGTSMVVEEVLTDAETDYTFVVIRDEDGNPKTLYLDNIIVTQSHWN